jgi:MoaA/NifB/PqqE/SkfB family radical SAM enzyme
MLRFPLRLTADLAMARLARRSRPVLSPVEFVDAAELLHHDSNHPVSHEKIHELVSGRSPVIWIGGSEPLHHPGVSHLVRAITQTGHFAFLETDGTLLRRRIHEFQPVSKLFLTVCLEPGERNRASIGARAVAWERAAEGIRAARLSGFLICVHVRVHAQTELGAMAELIQFSRSLDVDGIVVSPASGESNSADADAEALQRKTAEAQKLIGSKWWEFFSRLVEPAVSGEWNVLQSADETGVRVEQDVHAGEESVKVA